MEMNSTNIKLAQKPSDINDAGQLFRAYAVWLEEDRGISLAFQNFEQELSSLPGKYAAPEGAIYLARSADGLPVGTIAFRKLNDTTCEIKRLFVTPDGRGQQLGHRLIEMCLNGAREAGYTHAVLDTGRWMKSAQALYEGFGFHDIKAYYDNPFEDIRFMGADL